MMEVGAALSLQSCSLIGCEKSARKPGGFLSLSRLHGEERRIQALSFGNSKSMVASVRSQQLELMGSCSCKKSGGCVSEEISYFLGSTALESQNFHASADEALILRRKSEDVVRYLNGCCIYLVGMMGSGKTTVGKILAEVLGYSFFDSDKLVEQAVGVPSVAQIFEEYSESFFRKNESKVLRDLSSMQRLVVATGGGAVIRPINWRYMKKGITVWLDVPLEALARRISAVGTASRPLLPQEPSDPYTEAFTRLTRLSEERGEAYANANARVCLQDIAAKEGHGDVCSLTPIAIAIEALENIKIFQAENASIRSFSCL